VNVGRTLFSQVMDFVPWTSFDRIVARYGGDVRVRSLRCGEQFRIMAFAQMTYREILRDIEASLGAQPSKLYGMGLREAVALASAAIAGGPCWKQGNRVKKLCSDEACEEVVIPSGDFAAESEGILSPGSPD